MGRPRHSEGWIEEVGARVKKWRAHWYLYEKDEYGREKRVHRSKVVGLKRIPAAPDGRPPRCSIADKKLPVMNRWEAERELSRLVTVASGGAGLDAGRADSRVSFGWFWRHKWLPLREPGWKPSTRTQVKSLLETRLGSRWDPVPLREITAQDLARWLSELGTSYSAKTVKHCRTYMKAILEEAIEEDYLIKNPMRRVSLPAVAEEREKRVLTLEQVRRLRDALPQGRDRLIFLLAVTLGLRPGELFGLRWNDVAGNKLRVDETWGQQGLGTTKTKKSKAWVALPEGIAELLEQRRAALTPVSTDLWIFPSAGKSSPLRAENWRKRVLEPAGKRVQIGPGTEDHLGWVNFQVTRRTFATIAHDLGVSMKAVQAQMRHATTAMTADVYTQSVESSQYLALDQISKEILKGGRKRKDRKNPRLSREGVAIHSR